MEMNDGNKASGNALTIYVGELSTQTLESDLYRIFSTVGKVLDIKLTKKLESSFAFVTLGSEEEVERAIKEYKHYELHNRQIRLLKVISKEKMPPEAGNIVVKNLPEEFTGKDLEDAFSMFGEITSCKVALTTNGKSKGYGFVQFKEKKAAKKVIKNFSNLDGLMLKGKMISVEPYNSEMRTKEIQNASTVFTNCFIKNFPVDASEVDLVEMLEKHGKVTSFFFPLKEDGKPKGFAFANFESHNAALNAINNLHGKVVFENVSEPFYIQKAQKKEDRVEELRKTFEQLSMHGQNYKKNLYVTNIPEGFGVEELQNIFKEFGMITSILVGADAINAQKKYAYVCYLTPEEASIAVERGNEIYIDGERLQVTYFKNKTERAKDKDFADIGYKPMMPYMYQGIGFPSGGFKRERAHVMSSKLYGNESEKLYGLVLAAAPGFKNDWKTLRVSNEAEFASKVSEILLSRPDEEIRSMIGLNFTLSSSIASVIESIDVENDRAGENIIKD
ncbi:polyadenylate-binding protein [Ordospora colligata]|uniref:Polyadenylate-binding protein n=1 Tax=Ordospora colligata OC4 TaxID=1354746 RepID=A0A0B2UF60_9MICR|nr:polyadenylate-binding protein [Ordospora colligata OC4]KHN69696.1 polyadenylate-binding protein [Ordospora colligata OC4]TBU15815.1 polyadenylate-binding protein [Ordospora colligata]TBU15943.1 polyadenylate-binding protein [Ordospora colligata]TBU18837.1 polyadenylate-binding protein [Ordospora colligata]